MKDIAIAHGPKYAFSGTNERHLIEGLCRWNYFPNQKASASELPPSITTRRLTPEVMQKLSELPLDKERKRLGFDLVEFRSTRYNNVSRPLGLIHPRAYAEIVATIKGNHEAMLAAMEDGNSAITVDAHMDGRVLIMNYEDHEKKAARATEAGFGKSFRVQTDIANCFGSVYTHSLEWAVRGFGEAKNALGNRSGEPKHWSSALDTSLRFAKRNETVGLPIGPASSSMAVEVVLSAVDKELRDQFAFTRYVDDYTALCTTHEEAQDFILCLSRELAKYKMNLNVAKTVIEKLPVAYQDRWISELMYGLPPLFADGKVTYLTTSEAFQFLDHAVRINNETPDGSVIKFAVAALVNRVEGRVAQEVFGYVINLAWHYPILLPYLEKIDIKTEDHNSDVLSEKIQGLIRLNSVQRRSDGICWGLYYLDQLRVVPSDSLISEVVKSEDCVALAMLVKFRGAHEALLKYVQDILNAGIYERDQNWLLLYELYRQGLIGNPYSDGVFEEMKKYEVDFFCSPDELSNAEHYCLVCTNPFADGDIPAFDAWLREADSH